jgi:YVTN family beta-propeller protein
MPWLSCLFATLLIGTIGLAAGCDTKPGGALFGNSESPAPAGPATQLTATIELHHTAGGAAVDTNTHTLWIRGSAAGLLGLDTTTRQITATMLLPTSPDPPDVEIDTPAHIAYAPAEGPAILVVDLRSRTRIETIRLAGDAHGIALDRQRKSLYAAVRDVNDVADASSLAVINTDTRQVTAMIPMPVPPTVGAPNSFGVAVDTATGTVFVTNQGSGTVSIVDPAAGQVIATIPVGGLIDGPVGVAVDSTTHQAYVAVYGRGAIAVIDEATRSVTATIPGGGQDVAVDPPAHALYVTNPNAGTVSVIDTQKQSLVTSIRVGRLASGVAVDPDNGTVYVTDSLDQTVSILAPGKGTRMTPAGQPSAPTAGASASIPSTVNTSNPTYAPTTAIPAPNALVWQFKSPTGNIVCQLAPTGAACEIHQYHYAVPPRPPNCQQSWGDRIAFDVGLPASLVCHAGTFPSVLPTQAYATPLTSGSNTCVINEDTGVNCRDTASGHSFRVSQQSYDVG